MDFSPPFDSTRWLCCLLALAPVAGHTAEKFTFDEWLLAPVRVHLLSASNAPAIHTTLTEADIGDRKSVV